MLFHLSAIFWFALYCDVFVFHLHSLFLSIVLFFNNLYVSCYLYFVICSIIIFPWVIYFMCLSVFCVNIFFFMYRVFMVVFRYTFNKALWFGFWHFELDCLIFYKPGLYFAMVPRVMRLRASSVVNFSKYFNEIWNILLLLHIFQLIKALNVLYRHWLRAMPLILYNVMILQLLEWLHFCTAVIALV